MFRKSPESFLSMLVAYTPSSHGTLTAFVSSGGGDDLQPPRSSRGWSVRCFVFSFRVRREKGIR